MTIRSNKQGRRRFHLGPAVLASLFAVSAGFAQSGKPATSDLQNAASASNGKARLAWGRSAKAYTGSPAQIARKFMAERRSRSAARSKVSADSFVCRRETVVPTGVLVDVREQQKGLPVFNSTARVIVDAAGHVMHVTDETADAAPITDTRPLVSFESTCTFAEHVNPNLHINGKPTLGLWATNGQARLAYRVHGHMTGQDGKEIPYRLVIDAETGDLLDRVKLVVESCFHGQQDDNEAASNDTASLIAAEQYTIRLTLTDETVALARTAGLLEADTAVQEYTVDPATLASLKQARLSPVLIAGRTTLRTQAGASTGIDELAQGMTAAGQSQELIAGDNYGAGWDIPDMDYVSVGGTETGAPSGSIVTGITYRLRISPDAYGNTFYAGDYEVMLASERLLNQGQGITVYAPAGAETDGGFDDDYEDDYDVFIDGRWSAALDGEPADQPIYVVVADRFQGDIGNLNYVEVVVDWVAGGPDVPGDPNPPIGGVCTPNGPTVVFDPNPITTLGPVSGAIPTNAYTQMSLADMLAAPTNGQYTLSGPFCVITDIETPANTVPFSSTPDFGFDANDNCFPAAMCFYHISNATQRLRALGFPSAMDKPLRVDHAGMNLETNAWYTTQPPGEPGNGYLAFGNGINGRSIAEDADVLYHEYGHALQDNQNPDAFFRMAGIDGLEPGAIGEGFGDYWAYSMTYDANMKGPFQDPASLAEWAWDGTPMRRTDTTKVYPSDWAGEVHDDGEMWAAALVEIFHAIGREASDNVIVFSNYLVPTSGPTFADAAHAVLAADDQIYGGQHKSAIADIFVRRGFISGDGQNPGPKPPTVPPVPTTPQPEPTHQPQPDPSDPMPTDGMCGTGAAGAMMLSVVGMVGLGRTSRRRWA